MRPVDPLHEACARFILGNKLAVVEVCNRTPTSHFRLRRVLSALCFICATCRAVYRFCFEAACVFNVHECVVFAQQREGAPLAVGYVSSTPNRKKLLIMSDMTREGQRHSASPFDIQTNQPLFGTARASSGPPSTTVKCQCVGARRIIRLSAVLKTRHRRLQDILTRSHER